MCEYARWGCVAGVHTQRMERRDRVTFWRAPKWDEAIGEGGERGKCVLLGDCHQIEPDGAWRTGGLSVRIGSCRLRIIHKLHMHMECHD